METIYIAKYALTGGIKEIQAKIKTSISNDKTEYAHEPDGSFFTIGSEAFRSFEEAKKKAEEMRDEKIKSLERQIEELREMTF